MPLSATTLLWLFIVIQVVGLTSAFIARISEGYCCQTLCQRIFLLCLVLVSVSAVIGPQLGPGYSLLSGSSLAFMVLGAVCDFRSSPQADFGRAVIRSG